MNFWKPTFDLEVNNLIETKPSLRFVCALVVIYACATLILLWCASLHYGFFIFLPLLVISFYRAWCLHAVQSAPYSILSLGIDHDKQCCWVTTTDEPRQAQTIALMSSSFSSLWLVVLNVRLQNKQRSSLILMKDNIGADDFRRLRVWLKLTKQALTEETYGF